MLGICTDTAGSKAIVYHTRSPIAIGVDRTERQKLYSNGVHGDIFRINTFGSNSGPGSFVRVCQPITIS